MSCRRKVRSSAEWCAYFRANDARPARIPWERGVTLTERERRAIARSVQTFQLGESGEGKHLFRVAEAWAAVSGDHDYVTALRLFVGEEHRHAADLGRFLDLARIPRLRRQWTDGLFRWLRHRAGLELSIAVLVTAELIAKVYYRALRDATSSPILRRLCERILRDEMAHVRFQCERLALLRQGRSRAAVSLRHVSQRALMGATCLVVWWTHAPALRAGGFGFTRFWRKVHREFVLGLRMMDPQLQSDALRPPHCISEVPPREPLPPLTNDLAMQS